MIKEKTITEITIDCEHYGQDFDKKFGIGYEDFQYPFTVNFHTPGKYIVEISGKTATIRKAQ